MITDDRAAGRRRALVGVVAAGVEDQRRRAVPVVAARADDDQADRRLEAGRRGPVARRAKFAHAKRAVTAMKRSLTLARRFAIDCRADLELRVGAEHAFAELLQDLRLVEGGPVAARRSAWSAASSSM